MASIPLGDGQLDIGLQQGEKMLDCFFNTEWVGVSLLLFIFCLFGLIDFFVDLIQKIQKKNKKDK